MTFTHEPPIEVKDDFHELNYNINPKETGRKSHVKKYYDTSPDSAFEPGDYNDILRIHESDRDKVNSYKKVSHSEYMRKKKK